MIISRAALYSVPVIITLIIIVCFAGCSGPSDDTVLPSSPAISSVQPEFIKGDIIAKNLSSSDQFMLILNYNSSTGEYERAIVNKKSEGNWVRSNDKSEFVDRTLMEKVYPAKVGHVSSLSQVPVETSPSISITQTEFVPSPSTATRTITPIIIPQPSKATGTPTPTLPPETVKTLESTAGNSSPAIDIPALEMEIHTLINQQRRSNGLSDLSYDPLLASVARNHSADMAQNNYFSHYDLQGLDPDARAVLAGYSCAENDESSYSMGIAENIMQNNLYDSVTYYNGVPRYAWNSQAAVAQSTVSGWMGSSGHRENILSSAYDREGIGVAIAKDDKVYITEDFC
jgi:uncharacterized protein YkwD